MTLTEFIAISIAAIALINSIVVGRRQKQYEKTQHELNKIQLSKEKKDLEIQERATLTFGNLSLVSTLQHQRWNWRGLA